MAKYKMTLAGMVYQEGQLPLGGIDTPVIVLPEADWRRVAELATAMDRNESCCCPCDRPCGSCQEYEDVVAIIAKVEADNG